MDLINLDLIHFLRVRFMKLFKKLLIAPAALGLLSPMSILANEINIHEVANYSSSKEVKSISDFDVEKEIAITKSRVDGLEANFNNYEAGAFSETTTASFAADFLIGSEDGNPGTTTTAGNEAVTAGYSFGMKTKTSFTGEDTLQVKFDAGNADDGNLDEFDKHDKGDGLIVDGISYKFPIGEKNTAFVGDSVDGSSLYSGACVYDGPSKTLSDCGAAGAPLAKGAGTAAGASYDIGGGWSAAVAYTGAGSSTNGLMTKAGADEYGAEIAYDGEGFGVAIALANSEGTKVSTAENEYLQDTIYTAVNAYWTPEETGVVPSISVGFENGDIKSDETGNTDTNQWFVGVQWDDAGPGKLGAAMGSKGAQANDDTEDLNMYEVFYSYKYADGITITPMVYIKENAAGTEDQTGMMVKTTYKF